MTTGDKIRKKLVATALCIAAVVYLGGCESSEERLAREMGEQFSSQADAQTDVPNEEHDDAVYAKVIIQDGAVPWVVSGELYDYSQYSHGIMRVRFKEPVIINIGGKLVSFNSIRTHVNNVYIFYNSEQFEVV